jgi:hypothetical protein
VEDDLSADQGQPDPLLRIKDYEVGASAAADHA